MTDRPEQASVFRADILKAALWSSLVKLDPRVQLRNPVMFVVEVGAVFTTVGWLIQAFGGSPLGGGHESGAFTFTVSVWLWLTVVFANLAEALAEGAVFGAAVDQRTATFDVPITGAREVAFFPPFTGG